MNQTLEKSFIFLGISLFILLSIGSFILHEGTRNSEDTNNLIQSFLQDENITGITPEQIIVILSNGTIYMIILSMLSSLVGAISLQVMKRNVRAAGIMLITTGISSSLLTVFSGLIGSAAYLIAGMIVISKNHSAQKK
ncbi:DUF4064 domain-containing protein [Bacillus safensis]|uniref:DUF4064 domain-containing protein n=1 Tax=Bacillus safensis TaxID=561879 RepID=UPI002DBF2F63|nr:DUF4064 domain-containing protein [Bacillus safensis]MEC0923130.1 DUF4064 domain-containing protein [Bacillus safensis]MEC0996826.1 DUF4064 domain-containing protein [Bacillus safensis]MEC1000439.1 DUF4064 domain-containing protein [Bacillus safensis]